MGNDERACIEWSVQLLNCRWPEVIARSGLLGRQNDQRFVVNLLLNFTYVLVPSWAGRVPYRFIPRDTAVEDTRQTRTSAFSFQGKHVDLRIIGERLNVKTVLEGSVRKAGNRVRITAQLIMSRMVIICGPNGTAAS
jgi:hypothetical protein